MTQIDEVVQTCCETPDDGTARQALADLLRAVEDIELSDAVRGSSGAALLARTVEVSKTTQLPVSHRLLWAAYTVLPRLPQFTNLFTPEAGAGEASVPPPLPFDEDLYRDQQMVPLPWRPNRTRPGRPQAPPDSSLVTTPAVPMAQRSIREALENIYASGLTRRRAVEALLANPAPSSPESPDVTNE